jgi:hypothetical protein
LSTRYKENSNNKKPCPKSPNITANRNGKVIMVNTPWQVNDEKTKKYLG